MDSCTLGALDASDQSVTLCEHFVVGSSECSRAPSAWSAQNYGCYICRANITCSLRSVATRVWQLLSLPKCFLQNVAAVILNAFGRGGSHLALTRLRFLHEVRLARTTVDRIESHHASFRKRTVSRSTQTQMQQPVPRSWRTEHESRPRQSSWPRLLGRCSKAHSHAARFPRPAEAHQWTCSWPMESVRPVSPDGL